MQAIEASVVHFQWLVTTVMALAITEGLKQFVMETRDDEEPRRGHLRWRCFLSLFALLVTAMPYTFGMARYFFEAYRRNPIGGTHFTHLALDTLVFTLEAIGFFVMSRSLSPTRIWVFTSAALLVFGVDWVWVLKCRFFGPPSIAGFRPWWIVTDLAVVVLLVVCLWKARRWGHRFLYIAVCSILIVVAAVDLPLNWSIYFPATDPAPQTAETTPKPIVYFAAPLFTQAEWRWNARIADGLRKSGYEVKVPQESVASTLGKNVLDPKAVFRSNVASLQSCTVVVAMLDGADPDSGTAWECGYAHRHGRPVVGVRTDLRAGGDDPRATVNLMLSQCCREFVTLPAAKREDEAWLVDQIVRAIKRSTH